MHLPLWSLTHPEKKVLFRDPFLRGGNKGLIGEVT